MESTKINYTINLPNFLEYISNIMKEREEEQISIDQLTEEIKFMINNNSEHRFIKFVNQNLTKSIHKCLVFILAYSRLKGEYTLDIDNLSNTLFDNLTDQLEFMRNLATGQNEMIKEGFIRIEDSGFMNEKVITLNPKVIKVLYEDYPELYIEEETDNRLIKPGMLKNKKLFFNPDLVKQIDEITRVLSKNNFL